MLVYLQHGKVVAGGHEQHGRSTLHGHRVPAGHVCVHLTNVSGHVPAPVVLGDCEENAQLSTGSFFALPVEHLRKAQMVNGVLKLMQYS